MKKLICLCMFCLLVIGASAQKGKTSRVASKKTQVVAGFKNVDDFYKWVDGKTFVKNDRTDPHKFVFTGFWDKATNTATTDGAKIMDGDLEISSPYFWEVYSGVAVNNFEEYGMGSSVEVNKAKKILVIKTRGGMPIKCTLVEDPADNPEAFIKAELAKYIKNGRKNPNVVLSSRAKEDLMDSSWPEIFCKRTENLDKVGPGVVVKKVGENAYRYECKCTCGKETYVDNWIMNAVLQDGKVKILSFGFQE